MHLSLPTPSLTERCYYNQFGTGLAGLGGYVTYRYNVPLLFVDVVAKYGALQALDFDGRAPLNYADIDRLSNQAARFMEARGVRRGDRVAIALEKSPSAYVLILAALKLGAPYFALDPRNPAARIKHIVDQCNPRLLFSDGMVQTDDCEVVRLATDTDLSDLCAGYGIGILDTIKAVTGTDPAYIMFTSGSTGVPKGAVISHDNLLHFIHWARDEYAFVPGEVHANLNPLYFDNSVFDIYSTFFSGGRLVPFDYATLQDPARLVRRIAESGCTVWFSVPSLLMYLQTMKVANRQNLGGLRKIIFGGEGYPLAKLEQLRNELGMDKRYFNVYGPTECTCICSSHELGNEDFAELEGLPPLGDVIGNFTRYLLDGDHPVAPGEAGELCLGGPCVGLGYFNQPEQAARAFVQNPLVSSHRDTLYRTGDLVRVEPRSGKLHFVGRCDLQIKHMGYRIELEEIEHALVVIEGVDEVVVLHRRQGELSEIIAVIASRSVLTTNELRRELGERLPKYMIPTRFHIVEQLPKNANGKTDRPALKSKYAN